MVANKTETFEPQECNTDSSIGGVALIVMKNIVQMVAEKNNYDT